MSKFERWLCRHPRTAASCGGLLTGLVALCLSFGALLALLSQDIEGDQHTLAADVRKIAAENYEILSRLNADFKPECSTANLARINTLLFEYSAEREVGLYDAQDRVFCSSSMGHLPVPVADPDTVYRSRDENKIWMNTPSPASGGKGTMIYRRGGFNLAMSPRMMASLVRKSDVAWIGGSNRPVHVAPHMPPALLEKVAALEQQGAYGRSILLREGQVVFIRKVEDTRARFANFRPLTDAWLFNPGLSTLLLGLSLVCGVLTTGLLKPRIAARTSLRRLLPALLTAANMRCRYQPIVELASGRPVGCEVLVRLQNDDELLCPDQFIGLVQELGLAWQMDSAVIATALNELRALPLPAHRLDVTFNLFPDSLNHANIDALFRRHLADWGAAADSLRVGLEVTEYDFSEALIPELRQLREAGYHIAVDDFGTGYSNLNTVKKVAPDLLKIDKSFVFEMEDASTRSSLIPEIVAIARAVDARVVAEGVELDGQALQLAGLGVEYAQGYYFARPLALDEFVEYLRKHGVFA